MSRDGCGARSLLRGRRGHATRNVLLELRDLDLREEHGCGDSVSADRFGGTLLPPITWGRWSTLRGRRRTIRLGSYDHREGLIRIHPALDQEWVPRELVEAVVHHELLHAALPPRESGGRRCLHGPEFRRLERELPQHTVAERWLAANLPRLLRGRPRTRRAS